MSHTRRDTYKRMDILSPYFESVKIHQKDYLDVEKQLTMLPSKFDLEILHSELKSQLTTLSSKQRGQEHVVNTIRGELLLMPSFFQIFRQSSYKCQNKLKIGSGDLYYDELKAALMSEYSQVRQLQLDKEKLKQELMDLQIKSKKREELQEQLNNVLNDIFKDAPPIHQDIEAFEEYQKTLTEFQKIFEEANLAHSILSSLLKSVRDLTNAGECLKMIIKEMSAEPDNAAVSESSLLK
ncbi:hypothetical protein HK096_011060, partial [Nowakowskiella sp. JEL0078]